MMGTLVPSPVHFGNLRLRGRVLRCALAVLAALLTAAPAAAATSTSTTLTLSSGSVAAGTAVTLSAAIVFTASGNPYGGAGQVIFCDAAAAHCTDIHRIGTAQTTAGQANFKFIPAPGTHSYKALFVGTTLVAASTSAAASLTVTPRNATSTTITLTGAPGSYTLSAAGSGFGSTPPTGTVSFLDTSNANYVLGTGALVPGVATLNFSHSANTSTGSAPAGIATGDFDGDGKLDLAVANYSSNSVTILLGNGDGTFNFHATLAGFSNPNAIVAADFNNDGKLDLAVLNFGSNQVYVMLGTGGGNFGSVHAQATGGAPGGLAVGDFNNDGYPDLAVTNSGGANISVLLGQGNGSFTVAASPTAGSAPTSIAVADFNNDGNQDLVVTNLNDGTVTVLFGAGTGAFPSSVTIGAFGESYSVVTADFNGDGNQDFAVADYLSSSVAIFLGKGDGTFTSASVGTASHPIALAVGDFNGDGIPDLVAVDENASGSLSILLGKGDGTFGAYPSQPVGNDPRSVVVADFNGDGISDLAAPNYGDNTVSILISQLTQTAAASVSNISPVGTGTHQVVAGYPGDANFAGSTSAPTALTAQSVTTALTLAASPASSVTGQPVTLTATLNPFSAQGHSADGESVDFIAQGTVLLGSSPLSGGVATLTLTTLPAGSDTLTASFAGDANFTSSTSNTLAYTVASATSVTLAVSSGGAAVTSVASGSVIALTATVRAGGSPASPGLVAFCDAAAPHCTDIHRLGTAQLTSSGTATLRLTPPIGSHTYKAVFLGTASAVASSSPTLTLNVTGLYSTTATLASSGPPGNYTLTATIATPAPTGAIGTVSFVDTTNANAVVGSASLGSSTFSFGLGSAQTLATGAFPKAVATGDFNGDGHPDFIIANYAANTLTLELGNGDGTFTAAPSPSATLANPNAIAVGDFNGDGRQDLAVSNYANNTVSIFLGNGDGTFSTGIPVPVGNLPYAVVAADFNNDGKQDLAVVNARDNSVTVLLGNGDGTFTAAATLSTGNNPQSIVSADFNNDGNQDLAVSNLNDGTITVFFGAGNGSFPSSVTVSALGDSFSLATADLDADGNVDLVALNSSGNTVTILRGNGSGAFTPLASPGSGSFPLSVAIADLNGDGIPDIVTANDNSGNTLSLLIGNGDGTFQPAIPYATGITPQALALADFNGDGYADIVTANLSANNATVLLAQPIQSATATANNIFLTGVAGPHSVQANYPGDAAHATSTSNSVSLSPRPFAATPTFSPAAGTYTSAQTVTLASTTPGGIYYTTDGSTPTPSSPQYTTPLSVTASQTIRAFAAASGYQNSPVATAIYTVTTPPTITTQPASQTINSGSPATLAVAASGTTPLTYQWYSGTSPNTAAPIAGAAAPTYTTPNLTSTSSFWVQVNNASALPANSTTATITVTTPPTIATQPASQTINSGSPATLTVAATGTAPLSYQWYAGPSTTSLVPIAGATAATYSTPTLTATTYFQVQVANSSGITVTSVIAAITVTTAPVISTQPASQTINAGNRATLTVAASGTSPTYQWYSGASGNTAAPIAGATAPTYTTPPLSATSSFWVQAANQAGTANSGTAILTVIQSPICTLSVQPTSTALTVVATSECTDPQKQSLVSQIVAWGDGSSSPVNLASNTNLHTYATPGTYTVSLSATGASGLTGTALVKISPSQSPVCTLGIVQGQISSILTQYPVTVTASCTDPQGQPLTLSLDWGDSTVATPTNNASNPHVYNSPNVTTYNVVLTATDASGLTGSSAPRPVQIVPALPIPAGGNTDVNSTIPAPPLALPTSTQITFVCASVSVLVNGATITALPSAYGISCTSPTIPLTATPIPVDLSIFTSKGAIASNRQARPISSVALCGIACPFAALAFLLPLAPGRRRRFTALALIGILCLSLSACGGYFRVPTTPDTPPGLYYITLVETIVNPPAPTGFVQTSLIVPLPVTH